MATYYWIGGTTFDKGISGAPFDWNVPTNWRKIINTSTLVSEIATTVPGPADNVYIGSTDDALYSQEVSNRIRTTLRPKAPLLFGGFKTTNTNTGDGLWIGGATLAWIAGQTTGITYAAGVTSPILNTIVYTGKISAPLQEIGNGYPYPMLGMQLANEWTDVESLAQYMYDVSLIDAFGISGAGSRPLWNKSDWAYAINNNLLSYSGLTALHLKSSWYVYQTAPNPHNLYSTDIKINYVDLVRSGPYSATKTKYGSQMNIKYNGGNIFIKDAKFQKFLLSTTEGTTPYKAMGLIKIENSDILEMSTNPVWCNLDIDRQSIFGVATLRINGPQTYGLDLNATTNNYGNTWLRDNADRSKRDVINYASQKIRGTFSKTTCNPIFGITTDSNTPYTPGSYALSVELQGTNRATSYTPVYVDGNVQGNGIVLLEGLTAETCNLYTSKTPPAHYFTWNPDTNRHECLNSDTMPTPCSHGKLTDYLPDIFITGDFININEIKATNIDINTLYSGTLYEAGVTLPTYTIGKLDLNSSNIDLNYFGQEEGSDTSTLATPPDWRFGTIRSGGAGITLNGGIILDNSSTIHGCKDFRFLNYLVLKSSNRNTRTNNLISEVVGNTIVDTPRQSEAI